MVPQTDRQHLTTATCVRGIHSATRRFFLLFVLLQVLVLPEALSTLSPDEEGILAEIDTLWERGQRESSLVVTDSFLGSLDRESQPGFAAQLLRRRGMRHRFLGDPVSAESDLREAVNLASDQADSTLICALLLQLSIAIEQQGRSVDAEDSYRNLLAMAVECGDEKHEAWANVGLAHHAVLQGRVDEAVGLYTRASELFRRCGDVGGEVWALDGMGNALSERGAYREALTCFRRAVTIGHQHDRSWVEASALNNLGTIEYSLGNRGAALEAFERAYEIRNAIGGARGSVTPSVNIAICYTDLGRFDDAERILDRTLAHCREHGFRDLETAVMIHRATLDYERGRHREAAVLYRQVLSREDVLSMSQRLKALMGLGRALADVDSLESALAVLESGRELLAGQSEHELWARLKTYLGEYELQVGRVEEALTDLLSAADLAGEKGEAGLQVWALALAAEAYRMQGDLARSLDRLNEASETWAALRRLPFEPEWRERWSDASRQLYTYLAARLLEIPGSSRTEQIQVAFDRMQTFKARTLQERMMGPGEDLMTFAEQHDQELATLEQLQGSVLQSGELFLDFYLGPDTSFVFAVTSREARVAGLPNDRDLGERLLRYHTALSARGGGTVSEQAPETLEFIAGGVSQVVLGDVRDLVQANDRIYVSPDGALHLVPFAHLGADSREDSAREWIRMPSATILCWLRDSSRPSTQVGATSVLAIAGTGGEQGRSLPGAAQEVRLLGRRYLGVKEHVSDSIDAVVDAGALTDPCVIHIATHLTVDDQSPWQLAIPSIVGNRGEAIRTGEIAVMESQARLAVLSSCESAGGRVVSGEGVLGLSSAFLSAGVPTVVASLWPVSDLITARFMEHFYRAMEDGRSVVVALDSARHAMRSAPETRHPFYWAGFVVVGDGETTISLTRKQSFSWLVISAVLLAVSGVVVMMRQWRIHNRRG